MGPTEPPFIYVKKLTKISRKNCTFVEFFVLDFLHKTLGTLIMAWFGGGGHFVGWPAKPNLIRHKVWFGQPPNVAVIKVPIVDVEIMSLL